MEALDSHFESNIGVLEDEPQWTKEIHDELEGLGGNVVFVGNSREFHNILECSQFDALSIDWYIGQFEKGREALLWAKQMQPEAVRIVFTYDQGRVKEASLNADAVVLKSDLESYRSEIDKARILGRARRIAKELGTMGIGNFSPQSLTYPLSKPQEKEIYEVSRAAMRSVLLRHEKNLNLNLKNLLVSRRWWRTLDLNEFGTLPKLQKLRVLADFASVTPDLLAILTDIEQIQPLTVEDTAPRAVLGENADHLLSILGYVLRLSGYEPELMPHYWEAQGLFGECIIPPPWDRYGLKRFVTTGGAQSLSIALEWIRSH